MRMEPAKRQLVREVKRVRWVCHLGGEVVSGMEEVEVEERVEVGVRGRGGRCWRRGVVSWVMFCGGLRAEERIMVSWDGKGDGGAWEVVSELRITRRFGVKARAGIALAGLGMMRRAGRENLTWKRGLTGDHAVSSESEALDSTNGFFKVRDFASDEILIEG